MDEKAIHEKKRIALTSVIAAVFLTGFKLVVGLFTGSLGILSEALHSGLDLVAAGITFFAVRFSDKPADGDHHFGHGKIENFSALIETFLLLITCVWIVYEAVHRLVTRDIAIEVTPWSFVVIITSIIIDFSRSRALMKVAKKYNSQALEADALHFSTDILSSFVVLLGLVASSFSFYTADPVAALIVAVIVLWISIQLGKKSFDVLVDRAPADAYAKVIKILQGLPEILDCHDIKVRQAGAEVFVSMNIHVPPHITIEEAHRITHVVEDAITANLPNSKVIIHAEPDGM
ncbi:MAG: cation diffusion facilitator family transporter [Ignavibacteria bacterium]|nr:cation diffusion facilitator family transporter [Ignavibacteria bacterium]